MKNTSISLKITVIAAAVLGAVFYLWALPSVGKFIAEASPEFAGAYYPWLILFWITAIPCYIALALLWKVIKSIDTDDLFKKANADRFRTVAKLAYFDATVFIATNIMFLFFNFNHPSIVLASAFVCMIGIAFGICMKAMAGFFDKASDLQEENDLTI